MKKIAYLLFVVVMLLHCGFAFAEDIYENEICFRGVAWGASYDETLKAMPDEIKFYGLQDREYWYTNEVNMFDEGINDYYKGHLGCYTYTMTSSLKDLKVAGYEIENLSLYFCYLTGEDGLLIKDEEHTALVFAYYKLEPKDHEAVYEDLITKLTSLYGDVDVTRHDSSYISHTQNMWYGADETMVSVVKEDYPTGSHYIYIKYGFSGADDLIKAAYEAAVLEETRNAASNTDGL